MATIQNLRQALGLTGINNKPLELGIWNFVLR